MNRGLVVLFLLLGGCAAAPGPPASGPWAIDLDALPGDDAERVRRAVEAPTCTVDLPETEVRSRAEIYEFLLARLPFTAGVLRARGASTYRIWAEDENAVILDDGAGVVSRMILVKDEGARKLYYTYGTYDLLILRVRCRTAIVMRWEERGGALWTSARIYAKVDGTLLEAGGKLLGLVEKAIRKRGGRFIDAAREVAELAAADAAGLAGSVEGSAEVDPAALAEFRRRFAR